MVGVDDRSAAERRHALQFSLKRPSEIKTLQDDCPLAVVMHWIRNFLARPDPRLHRPGAVCPWVPESLARDSLYLGCLYPQTGEVEEILSAAAEYRSIFRQLKPHHEDASAFKAILAVFPALGPKAFPALGRVQRELKPDYVADGLMIGEFHRQNLTPSIRCGNFFPLQSPYPMLVIREMVESDIAFLTRRSDPPELRIRFLNSYLSSQRVRLSPSAVHCATRSLQRAHAELEALDSDDAATP